MAVLLLALVAGCEAPGRPDPANRPRTPNQILSFNELYSTNCAGCHGASGELGPAPPLNDALFATIVPKEELLRVIREGRSGTPMPAFSNANGGPLTEDQIDVLVDGVKSNWGEASDGIAEETVPSYLLTSTEQDHPSTERHERGVDVFARACAGCHGPNGAGVAQEELMGGAINVPAFLALVSDQALRRIIITGRPDLGMPSYAQPDGRPSDFQPLSSNEIEELVALLASWRAAGNIARTNDPSTNDKTGLGAR